MGEAGKIGGEAVHGPDEDEEEIDYVEQETAGDDADLGDAVSVEEDAQQGYCSARCGDEGQGPDGDVSFLGHLDEAGALLNLVEGVVGFAGTGKEAELGDDSVVGFGGECFEGGDGEHETEGHGAEGQDEVEGLNTLYHFEN